MERDKTKIEKIPFRVGRGMEGLEIKQVHGLAEA